MKKTTVFTRDFTLMILGQIISLFGNSILRFALSLYILDLTGSAAIFGSILAISMIPTILLSPIGGSMADRVSRRDIMVGLDFFTSGLCIAFSWMLEMEQMVLLIGGVMIILSIVQSFYQPAVQSSIPLLADDEHLMQANGIVVQINALANLIGPILGGLFYGIFGLSPILMISAAAFFASAVMEVFLHIPFQKLNHKGNMIKTVISDLREAIGFIIHENPLIFKFLLILALLNMVFSALLIVGLPYIIKIDLGLSSQLYGFAEAAMGLGSIAGALGIGYVSKHSSFSSSYKFLIYGGLLVLPIAMTLYLQLDAMLSYAVIIISIFSSMALLSMFNIFGQTFMQQMTPVVMLGKVTAFVTTVSMCSMPIGQAFYGVLFDILHDRIYYVVLFGIMMELILALLTRQSLKKLKDTSGKEAQL